MKTTGIMKRLKATSSAFGNGNISSVVVKQTPYQNGTESKGLKIEFSSDGSGVVVDQDVIYEFTWDLDVLVNENGLFQFQTTPSIAQLNGRLLICDNLMMTNDSYRDGADNFLVKVDSNTTK